MWLLRLCQSPLPLEPGINRLVCIFVVGITRLGLAYSYHDLSCWLRAVLFADSLFSQRSCLGVIDIASPTPVSFHARVEGRSAKSDCL